MARQTKAGSQAELDELLTTLKAGWRGWDIVHDGHQQGRHHNLA